MDKTDNLISKLEAIGVEKAKENLKHNRYSSWKISHVEEWIEKKESPTFMYHEVLSPQGKIFKAYECSKLEKKGWVDTPSKYGKSIRSKARKIKNIILMFLSKEWKWVLGFMATIATLYMAYLKL